MELKQITIKFGVTQSLGDYSNVRPEIEVTAVLSESDDPAWELARLRVTAVELIHGVVDDELEAAGREPKYYDDALYCVSYADKRGLVVIHPANAGELPAAENWQERDPWRRDRNAPGKMRPETAWMRANRLAREKNYHMIDCGDGDFYAIPGLPDPGPEPQWKVRNIGEAIRLLRIPEEYWDEVAMLPHVTVDYLTRMYHSDLEQQPLETRLTVIRGNLSWCEPESDEEE